MKINKFAVMVGAAALTVATAGFAASHNGGSFDNPNAAPGVFLGGNLGLARANYGDLNTALKKNTKIDQRGGFAGGVFGGYHFNEYLDAEIGYLYLPTNKYSNANEKMKLRTQDIYALGKVYLPLAMIQPSLSHISLYGEGGAALTMSEFKGSSKFQGSSFDTAKKKSWEPMYGAGVAYSINQNAVIDLGWTQIYGPKVSKDDTSLKAPLVNMAMVGFTYRFTNL